ncbi:PBS lyase HEAT domain protein repeat-containing protein (fragment) [Planktothrix sp. PCC 11201]|uniref:NACHT domain-containing protein n=1 Tax=Planktothrix sp. PCC 11201 TaxID=1729650 RepID=UPI00091C49DD
MARKYGKNKTTLNNVLKLVKALLPLADDKEIAVPGDKLKATFCVEWVKEDELLVSGKVQETRRNRTQTVEKGITKKDLWTLVEYLGEALELSPPKDEKNKPPEADRKDNAIQDILDCLKDLDILVEETIKGKPTVKTHGFWKFSLKLKHQTAEIKDNLKVIEERWQIKIGSIATKTSDETFRSKNKFLNWREICSQKLAEKKFTTKVFQRYGAELQLDKNYVRLAIVEQKLPKSLSRNQQEEKEEEKPIPIAEECFFEEVLRQGKSQISQGRKIAIIGEPGSGKTTRLQKIADWILKPDQEDLGFPIWIDLADLKNQNICQYLENEWLPKCKGEVKLSDLEPQISQAWLLLDGVDEMSHTQRMEQLAKDLSSSWVQDARVVVTCRVNVWEADKNAFSGFDVFRNLPFKPEQVTDYIRRWFAGIGDAATGESLEAELAQSENSRLKELIQNPLRLWMLCQIWQTGGGLPETQAGLYGQFVDWVYDWKADEEILDQREAIDTALARLALVAMEQKDEVSRSRLRESWVLKVLGSRPIFEAVKKLGLLNRVERFPEAICVFYHATFQEYFAALAVDDWDYFLPRNHVNFPVAGKEYRIFEPQWKQVILLWLGRDIADEEKEGFIEKLVNFDDGCENFYWKQAYLLAEAGIEEFPKFDFDKVLPIDKLSSAFPNPFETIHWARRKNKLWLELYNWLYPSSCMPSEELKNTSDIDTILKLAKNEKFRHLAIEKMKEIYINNPDCIYYLNEQIYRSYDKDIYCLIAWFIGEIQTPKLELIKTLIYVLENSQDILVHSATFESLYLIIKKHFFVEIISIIKKYIKFESGYSSDCYFHRYSYGLVRYMASNINYLDFYQAWYS